MILVTGGAGYIGSHCSLALLERGREVLCLDNLSTGHAQTVKTLDCIGGDRFRFVQGDLLDFETVSAACQRVEAVMHFAAFSQVGESTENPQKYYVNNLCGALNLLRAMSANGVKKLVFSSSAAVYGSPLCLPMSEDHPQQPLNPYGQTKLFVEQILDDYDRACGLKSVRLRYFNAAGADSLARIGEWHDPETHLIPNIFKSALGAGREFSIYGDDYPTRDGTCVRDYVNVEDLAGAHLLALEYLEKGGESGAFNLGTGSGATVREVFAACRDVCGKDIPLKVMGRRPGDPAGLVADSARAKDILGWEPVKSLHDSIATAWAWERKMNKMHVGQN